MAVSRASDPESLFVTMVAVAAALSPVRRQLRGWLVGIGWPEIESDDILLAVDEALANVVDHAYPPDEEGTASLHAWRRDDPAAGASSIVVTVVDHGRWGTHHPASPAPEARGRGLAMMRACSAELHVLPSASGTSVVLVSTAVANVPGGEPSNDPAAATPGS